MSDVKETLQELMHRRLRELGRRRGSAEPLSIRQVHQQLPLDDRGKPIVSYETFRQIHTGVHSGAVSDVTAKALALALEIDVDEIYVAAGQRPRLGPFELPPYAAQLDGKERRAVLAIVDAILAAGGRATEDQKPTTAGPFDEDLDALEAEVDAPIPIRGRNPGRAARKDEEK